MFEDYNICPYTGLRSFTEEESIYFKGRDEHIQQATTQLEKNKFLMLTGASGDGKSSLVYAGIIPNARSGFLKATYSNWQVIDFRPERSPFRNLCESVAKGLGINNVESVEAELHHGFSALVDLYKSSKCYHDESSKEWQEANEDEKGKITRGARNLIILADQFEEFFTNPENYQQGVPSTESSLVLNLLLETAQIALEENLPIYVVFTMRSDYIGQCAAFRGLPEYIGFSQFFVPRMNRKQLREVIEEPAILSGNKISHRLTERLIEHITDGTDQLPMLQHALNQIWKMADMGKEEMDLIHYAMVGGLASSELPDLDQEKFIKWFDALPKKIKVCYDEASLQNVLNTHANKLLNHAADYVTDNYRESIKESDAKHIIKQSFKCLTKINEGRAVRNRMTLQEITNIINKPGIDEKIVNLVLNVYRDSTNTLLKPFIGENNENLELSEADVLDITHESLIRNWTRLNEWAQDELENYTIYLDFKQQLERWLDNDKSSDYLLSIGPLTYFEDWFVKTEPNKYWVASYNADNKEIDKKLEEAQAEIDAANEFLKRSANKHYITRTVVKYGPRRIAAVITIVAVLVFSSFTIKTYLDRTNTSMREFFLEEMNHYANDPSIKALNVVAANMEQLRLQDASADEVANRIDDYKNRVNILGNTNSWMLINGGFRSSTSMLRFMSISDSLLSLELTKPESERDITFLLKESNDLMAVLKLDYYHNRKPQTVELIDSNTGRLSWLVKHIINNRIIDFGSTDELNTAIEYVLNEQVLGRNEINELIENLSPFNSSDLENQWIKKIYPETSIYEIGSGNRGFNYNGLYQQIAYLAAASGNLQLALNATDSLIYFNKNYTNESYFQNADNAFNVAQYFTQNGYSTEYYQYINEYCSRDNVSKVRYYQYLMAKSLFHSHSTQKMSSEGVGFLNKYHNANIDMLNQDQLAKIAKDYRQSINDSDLSTNEKTLLLALSYKDEGIKLALLKVYDSLAVDQKVIHDLFSRSFELYNTLPENYLEESIPIFRTFSFLGSYSTRKELFLYPDKISTFRQYQNFGRFTYTTPAFIKFIIDNNLLEKYYGENLNLIDDWYTEYVAAYTVIGFAGDVVELPYSYTKYIVDAIEKTEIKGNVNLSFFYLNLGNYAAGLGDLELAIEYYKKVDSEVILSKLNFGPLNNSGMYKLALAISDLSRKGELSSVHKIIESFNNPINRSSLYAMAAKEAIKNHGKLPYVDQLIDSSFAEMKRVKNTDVQPNRNLIAAALAFRNQDNDIDQAFKIIKNERDKSIGIWWISRGLAFNNDLYRSYDVIPDNLSDDDVCGYLYEVYHDFNRNNRPESKYWVYWEKVGDNNDSRIQFVR